MNNLSSKGIYTNLNFSEVGITDGLVGWWPLNGNANDISGNANNGTNVGAVISSGLNNLSYWFDGTGDTDGDPTGAYVSIPEAITRTIDYPNGCTYSFWINVDVDAVDRMALLFGAPTMKHLEIYSITKYFRTEAALENGYSFGSGNFPDNVRGVWSHFTIVFAENEINRPVRWYQNGNLFHTGSMNGGIYPGTEYFAFNALGRATGTTDYLYANSFKGKIEDVRIYNRALSADEVNILYELGNTANKVKQSKNTIYIKGEFNELL